MDSVLDTGMRKIVYLDLGDGSYQGREVMLGPLASSYIEGQKEDVYPVVSGVREGDRVVTKGNFLIDSQSQISGIATAYSGALETKKEEMPPVPND